MRLVTTLLVPVVLLLFTGCSIKHDYVWNEYPIEPGRVTSEIQFREGQPVSIVKGKSDSSKIELGYVGAHQYYGSVQSLTDGIAEQLASELEKRGLEVNAAAEKSLEIAVNRSRFDRGMWKIAAILDFTVAFGNGTTKSYSVRNSSPATVERTYNGAVAVAVIEILNDPDVLAYINE
jgi:hypothetical protein